MENQFRIQDGVLTQVGGEQKRAISEKKLQANRQNALESTGPKTERGKGHSRYNAVKHGTLASALLLRSGARKAEFNRLVRELRKDLQPVGRLQELLVEEMAVWYLRKQRVLLYESAEIVKCETAKKSRDEQGESIASERRQLIACLKAGSRDVRRLGLLSQQTFEGLESLMEKSVLQEFHEKLSRASLLDLSDQNCAESEPRQGSAPPAPETARTAARLRVIVEYLEPLEVQSAEEDQRVVVQDALASLPPVYITDRILRYQAHIDRRLSTLLVFLNSLQSRERTS
jgi:hypothetical protein